MPRCTSPEIMKRLGTHFFLLPASGFFSKRTDSGCKTDSSEGTNINTRPEILPIRRPGPSRFDPSSPENHAKTRRAFPFLFKNVRLPFKSVAKYTLKAIQIFAFIV